MNLKELNVFFHHKKSKAKIGCSMTAEDYTQRVHLPSRYAQRLAARPASFACSRVFTRLRNSHCTAPPPLYFSEFQFCYTQNRSSVVARSKKCIKQSRVLLFLSTRGKPAIISPRVYRFEDSLIIRFGIRCIILRVQCKFVSACLYNDRMRK